tara:strand:+ start:1450 stop:2172 length:723 start_codon:yes stop_codon:yes gene_type:complete
MKQFLEIFSLSIFSLLVSVGCTRTASQTGPLTPYPEITSDIEIGETVSGEGTRAELLGIFRWGDPGRASFRAQPQEICFEGKTVHQSMQSAVYSALQGNPDQVIVDPQFHVVEHDFLVFKTATTKVVGRRGQHTNYRQVKRFNTDKTSTLRLAESPQHYIVSRNGKEVTKIQTSGNITPHVSKTANVIDTSSGVHTLSLRGVSSARQSFEELESNIQALQVKLDAVNSSSNGDQTASWKK